MDLTGKEDIEWTVEYFKELNVMLETWGLPTFIIYETEEGGMLFKDELHEYLGIGAWLTRRSQK